MHLPFNEIFGYFFNRFYKSFNGLWLKYCFLNFTSKFSPLFTMSVKVTQQTQWWLKRTSKETNKDKVTIPLHRMVLPYPIGSTKEELMRNVFVLTECVCVLRRMRACSLFAFSGYQYTRRLYLSSGISF